ncbi:MAG TPA: hypothetical protein PK957_01005 [Candidatus Dojkabacteria bacterium]|nr:hypothetical protein [Candidatus Dojkabacteria bacterium]HQF36196.1 hypothetical protein [Candidatus Dojkabacteria bacterium]
MEGKHSVPTLNFDQNMLPYIDNRIIFDGEFIENAGSEESNIREAVQHFGQDTVYINSNMKSKTPAIIAIQRDYPNSTVILVDDLIVEFQVHPNLLSVKDCIYIVT